MNRSKTNACHEIKEEFDDSMTTPLDGWNILDQVPDKSPQKSSTLVRSSAAAPDLNSGLPKEPSVESGTLLDQFNQLMDQQRLLVCGGLDRLQQKMEEGQNKIRKQFDEWELKMAEVRAEAIKGRQEIEIILADNRVVLASIASTCENISDGDHTSVLPDGDCFTSSTNQVPPELPSNVSSTPPETVQSPNVNVTNINHEHLNEQPLNNKYTSTRVNDVTSNMENGGKNSGTVLEGQKREDNANYSNDQTVAQSDLFLPSTSTGRGSNRIDVSLSLSQTVHSPNVSHIKQEHFDKRVDNEPKVDDVFDGLTSGLRSSTRKRIQTKVFGVDQLTQGDKRKSDKTESTEATKRSKPGNDDEAHQEDEGADKVHVVILELNCTAPGCKSILNTFDEWNEHLWTVHGLIPYQQLVDNARDNQDGLTEYPCTECEVVCKSQRCIKEHWRHYHQAGKFECSVCGFGVNFRSDILNHLRDHRTRNRSRRAHHGRDKAVSNNDDLEQPTEQSHSGETNQFKCTWDKCEASFALYRSGIRHVRSRHFHLPRTLKEQEELNIIDERDPSDYVQIVN